MNWKGHVRKRSVVCFKVLFQHDADCLRKVINYLSIRTACVHVWMQSRYLQCTSHTHSYWTHL